ncbi:MAG TPA: rhomboid family intramembrane serine protease [Thermomicrobiales bacterium]|nr:rhomboid family intramembrane serine protease [Thermomicrobiales bacterium]
MRAPAAARATITTPVRLKPYVPWTDGSGRRWRGWLPLPAMIPFTLVYIVAAWVLFVPEAELKDDGLYWIDDDAIADLVFQIPDLTENPPAAARSLITGLWFNHDSLQLIYVTALLLTFGALFELREGTFRTVLVFAGTSALAAVISGALLHLVYPHPWDERWMTVAWNRNWMGGSAGCFGVLGATAARAQRPVPLLAFFVAWECVVWWINLRNYTSAFHLVALGAGFVAARWLLPAIRPVDASTS